MKQVSYFLFSLLLFVALSVSCKHRNPADEPHNGSDTLAIDTPINTIDSDSLNFDTLPNNTIDTAVIDTNANDTDSMPSDLDSISYKVCLSEFIGVINVDESGYESAEVRVELAKSDSAQDKLKMILYQVSFDSEMPVMDIMLEYVSYDDQGNIWCDSISPIWVNAFGVEGFNIPFAEYMVYSMRGQTWRNNLTNQVFYSTLLDINDVGHAHYLGSK